MDWRHEGPAAVQRLQAQAVRRLGLEARPGKETLLQVRTARHMRELGMTDPEEYARYVESDTTGARMQELMDLLTTNHTAFWREAGHFEWLQEQLSRPARETGRVTIWCAASSSGEEPYTLAMMAREAIGAAAPEKIRILATDISTRMLRVAEEGVYGLERIAPLPARLREQYFEPWTNGRGGRRRESACRVKPEIRQMVHFRRLNLVQPFPSIGPFPYIFCRNVMIYFSQETRMQIVTKLLQKLTPDGYLLVGYAEGLSGLEADTDYVKPAIYRKRASSATAVGGQRWD